MPSFASVAIALVALSASAFASSTDNDLFSNNLAKRRVNHADEYHYPHHLGPHVDDGKKMSPGGYHGPRPSHGHHGGHHHGGHHNHGRKCHDNWQCHTSVSMARPVCDKGSCSFTCTGNTVKSGNKCVPKTKPQKQCKFNASCRPTKIANAYSVCNDGKCDVKCTSAFYLKNGKCESSQPMCGKQRCPLVRSGYTICQNNKCVPQCNKYLGFTLSNEGGKYQCTNTQSDPNHCGTRGTVCPASYNGLGRRTCKNGQCGLDCGGYKTKHLPNGNPYCSKA